MKMKLLKDGLELSGPEVWRLAFPVKGCVAKPADAEAKARVGRELETVDSQTRARLVNVMGAAGTLPSDEPSPVKVEEPAKLAAVPPKPFVADPQKAEVVTKK